MVLKGFMRLRIAFAAAACAAALVAAGPVTAASAAYGPHRCYVRELAAGLHGSQAGLGNRGFVLTLTDISDASCRLGGYPGLGLRDAAGRPLRTVTRPGPTYFDPDPGWRLIVLSPGETVSADVAFGVAGSRANSVSASCLDVTPPGGHRALVLRIPYGPALVDRGRVEVTALARHTPYFP
jgi:uncharacterized protein DUF4232